MHAFMPIKLFVVDFVVKDINHMITHATIKLIAEEIRIPFTFETLIML